MIRPEQIIPLFLEVYPGLQPTWTRYVIRTMNGKAHSFQQNPVFEVVSPYILNHVKRNYFKEIPAVFAVIEMLLSEGDEEIRILVETDLLIPLQAVIVRSPQTALLVSQWLGPRTQAVWHVIEHFSAEQEQAEQEQTEEHFQVPLSYSFEENRQLYMAFGLVGGGPTGLTYMGLGGGETLVSLGILLLIWIGLSIAERFQRKRLMANASEQESSENDPGTDGPDRFMVKWMWRLLDRAIVLLFVLGIPIGLSIVVGHKNFLDSSLLDILIVVVGVVVLVAIMCRDRLWKRFQVQENDPAFHDQHAQDEHNNAVDVTETQPDSKQSRFSRDRYAA
jgi:hypothetical protein